MSKLLIATDMKGINLVRYIAAEGRAYKKANVHNRTLKEIRKIIGLMSKPGFVEQ